MSAVPKNALPVSTHNLHAAPNLANQRVVFIGTEATIGRARDQVSLLPGGPKAIGCVLVDATPRPTLRVAGGLPVLGSLDTLPSIVAENAVAAAIVSLPAAMADTINRVRSAVRRVGIEERFVPTLEDLLNQSPPFPIGLGVAAAEGSAGQGWMRPAARIDIAELIGRKPHDLDHAGVSRLLAGKRVLITGAGGSIGSELARVVASFAPSQVQLMERAENALFEIDAQLGRKHPTLSRRAILHDVVDAEGTLRLLVDLRPHVIFHAAAHKHVPLMEDHPAHAVNNNLFGTKSIADAAAAVGAERFVFVSTDKAVNPTSVMGATKRLAEQYVQSLQAGVGQLSGRAGTRYSIVRFGNVLGSACSVMTIWSTQLAEGGPITVTDPAMTRFFMTIPEAATLVIQSAALEREASLGAAVYVLDMGKPLPILELAKRFIRAHGFEPREVASDATTIDQPAQVAASGTPTMDIRFTGIRPGEKLYEELAYAAENLAPTSHAGIRAWDNRGTMRERGTSDAAAMIADLSGVRATRDRRAVVESIRRWVPEMHAAAPDAR